MSIAILSSILFYKSKRIKNNLKKIRDFIKTISVKTNLIILGLSFSRYLIFGHQLYFLLLVFNVDISYDQSIIAISSIYFIASIIPMLSFFDVILKGSIAVWVFSFFNIQSFIILEIITIMWLLNFAIPAIFGSYFVITFKPKIV